MAVGGCTVKLYMNIEEVVAMASLERREPAQFLQVWGALANRYRSVLVRKELTRQLGAA
jgi:hypothetical protein